MSYNSETNELVLFLNPTAARTLQQLLEEKIKANGTTPFPLTDNINQAYFCNGVAIGEIRLLQWLLESTTIVDV